MSFAPEVTRIITLILLTVLLYIRLKDILNKGLVKIKNNYADIEKEYRKLLQESEGLKKENSDLEKGVNETVALFDITKEICKTLDVDRLFGYFKDSLNKYLEVGDCKFLKHDADINAYNNYTILPLEIDKRPIGYLVARDIREEDKSKFYILSQQLILGIKRALLYQKVQGLAITDSLTGIFSRRYFMERFKEELERSKKQNFSLSFIMVDVDYFKKYNDRYGHLVGDVILREVSNTIKENTRQIDSLGKYGGDEFSLILSETDKTEAELIAERIRRAVEAKQIRAYDEVLKITVSIGISAFPFDDKNLYGLIEKADWALYQAKQSGRNKVRVYKQ